MRSKKYFFFLVVAAVGFYSPLRAQVINTFAGSGTGGYGGDHGPAYLAALNRCTGVAFDGAGNVYIADHDNNVVRRVDPLGTITTFAGNDTAGYSGDGNAATHAQLNRPYSVATDATGNVYISDNGNNVIRIVDPTGTINTYAGNGTPGYSGDGSSANGASLSAPLGIAVDNYGDLYIADAGNHVVREVNGAGVISTIAGNGTYGFSGDNGAATSAELSVPSGVAVDAHGNVYIADENNNVVRKVLSATGNIVPFAGNGYAGFGGDGGDATAAQMYFPSSVTLDNAGSVYITDQGNNTVRRVDSLGKISIFAGTHTVGYAGDGGVPTSALLNSPSDVSADGWGRIYICDYGNSVIRVVTYGVASVAPVTTEPATLKVYPNPSTGSFTLQIPETGNTATVRVLDILGNVIETAVTDDTKTQAAILNLNNIPSGSYIVKVSSGDKTYRENVVVVE